MTIAAKHLDPLVGLDTHIILIPTPAGPVPTPLPHPYVGMVFDPFDYAPFIGATTFVNGLPRGQAGTAGIALPPHLPMGGPFLKPPTNESEIFMGSAVVCTEGEPQSFLGCMVLSCQDIGMPPPPRVKRKSMPKTLLLPTTTVLSIPMGMLVLIGGPPTISLTGLAFSAALGALKKLKKTKLVRKISEKIHAAAEKAMKKRKLGDRARNLAHKAICAVTGHPVDIATGKVFTDRIDFELPGPIPFQFERTWFSTSTYRGPLGHGWHHSYDQKLLLDDGVVLYQTADGRYLSFPHLEPGTEHFDRKEKLTFFRDDHGYALRTNAGHTYRFVRVQGRPQDDLPLAEIRDTLGNTLTLSYDAWGRLAQVVDCAGRRLDFASDSQGRIVSIAAPHPDQPDRAVVVARYAYDEQGDLSTVWDALGQPQLFQYQAHLLVRETDRNGLSFYFSYEGPGPTAKCLRTWGDGGIYDHKLSYDVDAGITVVENSLGHKTAYTHWGGLVVRAVDPLGAVTETEYGEDNEVLVEVDALGQRTEFKYDERNNLTERKSPDGSRIQLAYDSGNRPVWARDALGGEWAWKYDTWGRLLERINPLGETTRFDWQGRTLSAILDPAGQRTAFGYDEANNLLTLITPDRAQSRWSYDALGRVRSSADPNGNLQRRERDLAGRVTRVHEPDGNLRSLSYDGEGNVIRAADRHYNVIFSYQGMGRLATRSQAGTTVRFEYDTEEQLVAIHNEHGAVYRFILDPVGNVSEEHGFDGLRRAYQRDLAGRVEKVLRPAERSSSYRYDAAGRVIAVAHSDGSKEQYRYRPSGELILAANDAATVTFERDLLGRILRETQGADWIASEYDSSGRRSRFHSSKGVFQTIRRNAMGDVLAVEANTPESTPVTSSSPPSPREPPPPRPFLAEFTRDRLGLELDRTLPGGIRSHWHRDPLGRPERQEIFRGAQFHSAKHYIWDVNDRLTQIIHTLHGPVHYHHDAFGNLASAVYGEGRIELRMPDAVGNLFRTQQRNDRRYGPAGQLLEAWDEQGAITRYEYDPEGNLLRKQEPNGGSWTYEWNGAGMLSRVTRPDGRVVEFKYDALGRRISKRYREKTTRWLWDGNVPLHEWVERDVNYVDPIQTPPAQTQSAPEVASRTRDAWLTARPAQGPPTRGTQRNVPAGSADEQGIDGALQGTKDSPITWLFEPESFAPLGKLVGGKRFGIVVDHLGTPTGMFDEEGAEVWGAEIDTYGELHTLRGDRAACPFRWPGQYEDGETGLYYNRFRYYDREAGEYVSQDPIGLAGGMAAYGYPRDPLTWVDPNGLAKCGDAARGAKPVTGLLSDVTVISRGKVVGRGTVDLRGTLEGIKSGKIGPRDVFQNREGLLPAKPGGYYQEFLHPTPGVQGAGSQRIIQGQGGELFYTPDHYKSFIPLN